MAPADGRAADQRARGPRSRAVRAARRPDDRRARRQPDPDSRLCGVRVSRRAAPGAGERPGEHPGVGCGYQLCGSSAVTAAVRRAPGRARNARAVGGHRLVCIVRDRRWHGCLPPRGGPVCAVGRREPGAGQVAGVLVCPAVRRPGRRCGQASAAAAWSGRASACAAGVRLAAAGVHCPRPAGGACTASGSRSAIFASRNSLPRPDTEFRMRAELAQLRNPDHHPRRAAIANILRNLPALLFLISQHGCLMPRSRNKRPCRRTAVNSNSTPCSAPQRASAPGRSPRPRQYLAPGPVVSDQDLRPR